MSASHFIALWIGLAALVFFGVSMIGAFVASRGDYGLGSRGKSTYVPAVKIDGRNEVFIRSDTSELPVLRARVAASLWQRTRGLLMHPVPGPGHALLIQRCWSIHTVGMAYPIDVVFFDNQLRVTRVATVPPLRLAVRGRGGKHALEMAAGEARRLRIAVGQHLHIKHTCELAA